MGAYSLVAFPQAVNEAPRHNWPRCHPLPQCGHVRAKDGCSAAAVRLVGQRRRHLKPMWLVSIEELQLKTTMWWPVDWGWVEWLSHHNRYQPGSLPREVFPRGSPPSIFECASAAHLLGARCARRTKLGILGSAHIICEVLWGLLSLVVVEWRSEYSSFRLEEGWAASFSASQEPLNCAHVVRLMTVGAQQWVLCDRVLKSRLDASWVVFRKRECSVVVEIQPFFHIVAAKAKACRSSQGIYDALQDGYGRILGGKGPERENRKSKNRKSIIC